MEDVLLRSNDSSGKNDQINCLSQISCKGEWRAGAVWNVAMLSGETKTE